MLSYNSVVAGKLKRFERFMSQKTYVLCIYMPSDQCFRYGGPEAYKQEDLKQLDVLPNSVLRYMHRIGLSLKQHASINCLFL